MNPVNVEDQVQVLNNYKKLIKIIENWYKIKSSNVIVRAMR